MQFNPNQIEGQEKLKFRVNELGKIIGEVVVEPNLWFLPFHSASYLSSIVSPNNGYKWRRSSKWLGFVLKLESASSSGGNRERGGRWLLAWRSDNNVIWRSRWGSL
ncbi:unnamed protein product [Fraxinus pennsylvanica]|uniref:Uncharacterized protein n=1 Tax=Fraxinus pennsylvanica TaxID=56036 RepID=A0AAD2DH78_9LAMI|nr:unnamed protein product [Fraxinus pennsylvanica]